MVDEQKTGKGVGDGEWHELRDDLPVSPQQCRDEQHFQRRLWGRHVSARVGVMYSQLY